MAKIVTCESMAPVLWITAQVELQGSTVKIGFIIVALNEHSRGERSHLVGRS